MKKIKVLYITGAGRSGSTILGNVLGQIDGFRHVGELYSLWDVCLLNDQPCGCGRAMSTCDFWQRVLYEAVGSLTEDDVRQMVRLRDAHLLPTHEVPIRVLRPKQHEQEEHTYAHQIEKLYGAIQHVSGCEWIVDSSKIPSQAYLLSTMPSVELHVLHLVRDARAVAYSWQRKAINGFRPNISKAMVTWSVRNVVTEVLGVAVPSSYVRLLYENFSAQPRHSTYSILAQLGIAAQDQPFISDHEVRLAPTHTVWGNPSRHRTGTVAIRPDRAWEVEMPSRTRMGVAALTWPLLLRYGYLGRSRDRSGYQTQQEQAHIMSSSL